MSHTESALSGDSGRGPKWDLFRYFLAVARSSSVSGATQVLHESPPTVSRKVRELERHFSASLFSRGPGKLTPTLAGDNCWNG
jgi:DNA-binding transcriptional LysR family regulator